MHQETIIYQSGKTKLKGYIAHDDKSSGKRPAVIIAHAWRGQDSFVREKADELAKLGYVGFAADVFGDGKTATNDDEATQLMMPLFLDRQLLRDRIVAAYNMIKKHPTVDPKRIGAIGFCFGGLTAIELFRSGVDLRAVVSFHGLLGSGKGEAKAKTVPIAKNITGSILVLHGYDDPLVSREDIAHFQNEMTTHGIDWQMHIYGQTVHAFTNPQAHDQAHGLVYNARAAKRAWQSMRNFFEEVL